MKSVPQSFAELHQSVYDKYPDLTLNIENGRPLFRGSFPVLHEGEELDRFLIEITFPEGFTKLPMIQEIGGRIPRTVDRHVYTSGAICTEVPELTILRGNYSLLAYLDGPVRNYFIGQSLIERGKPWPFGQWSHGKAGLIEAYGEVLGVSDEIRIRRYLDYLGHKKIKGHWPCPCGSGRRTRECHISHLRALQQAIQPRVARQALERLERHSIQERVVTSGSFRHAR